MMLREKGWDLPVLPTARLVALGNCYRNIAGHRTDAPTLSEAGTHLVFQRSASWRSDLFQGDVSQAFLNGMNLGRDIYLHLPHEGLPGVAPGSILKVNTSVYGMADTPRAWWLKLAQTAEKAGWRQSRLEKALLYCHDAQGSLVGIGGPHVDDWVCIGVDPVFAKALKKPKDSSSWGAWDIDKFSHCGRQITPDKDGSVLVNQDTYIGKVKPIVPETRRKDVSMSDSELSASRSVLGTWAGQLSRHSHTAPTMFLGCLGNLMLVIAARLVKSTRR